MALIVTDPPWRMYAGEADPKNLPGDPARLNKFRRAAPYALLSVKEVNTHLAAIRAVMVPGAHAYVFLPSGEYFEPAIRGLIDSGWTFLRLLIWDKAPHGGGGIGSTWSGSFEPVAILSNGAPRAYPAGKSMFPTMLRQRPRNTRTGKPWELYRVFIEASTRPGDVVVDPYCGLNPLAEAAEKANGGPRQWLANDILTPAEVAAQAKRR